jgi:hypothetical protein
MEENRGEDRKPDVLLFEYGLVTAPAFTTSDLCGRKWLAGQHLTGNRCGAEKVFLREPGVAPLHYEEGVRTDADQKPSDKSCGRTRVEVADGEQCKTFL